jgi:hypothetical protein
MSAPALPADLASDALPSAPPLDALHCGERSLARKSSLFDRLAMEFALSFFIVRLKLWGF